MKKLLLSIVIILIMILVGITAIKGLQIAGLNILGIPEIKQKNDELDTTIQQATKLASTNYQKKLDDLNETIKKLQSEKSKYEDMVNVSTESEIEAANQSYDYKIDFLLIRVENHAKSEGVTIKMDLSRGSSGAENVYNINFTATGPYIGVADFIANIEDDSKLGFRIEDFRMTALSGEDTNTVQATFVCKDISIEGISTTNPVNTNTNVNGSTNNNDVVNSTETINNTVVNNTVQ